MPSSSTPVETRPPDAGDAGSLADDARPLGPIGEPFAHHLLLDRVCARMFGSGTGPSRLARYELRDRVGAGSTSVVWRAWDPLLRRDVAIKIVASETSSRAAVRREARVLAMLDHPSIVRIFDVGEWREGSSSGVYLVEEYLPGGNLAQWLADRARSDREIIASFCQVASALMAAHRVGIIHRDFKPGNVFLSATGHPKLGDFGLAHVVGEPRRPQRTPELGTGTPLYMAPEQHDGRAIDARADQFAVCATLFEAIFGRPPFLGADVVELAQAKRAGPSSLTGAIPRRRRRLWHVLVRGLAPEPAQRWPDIDALLTELRAATRSRWRTAAVTVAPLTLGIVLLAVPRAGAEPDCAQVPAVDELWAAWHASDPGQVLRGTDGGTTGGQLRARVETLVTRWGAARQRVCDTTPAGQAPAATDTTCLEQTYRELRAAFAMIDSAVLADPSVVIAGLESLSDPIRCLDDGGIPPGQRSNPELHDELVAARVAAALRRYAESLHKLDEVIHRAGAEGDQPILYEALVTRARRRLSQKTSVSEDDLDELQRVYFLATRVDQHLTATQAFLRPVTGLPGGGR